jgi:uncharacterized protein (TIGR00369 family)
MDEKLAQFKNLGKLMSLSNTEGYAKTLGLEAVDVEIGKVVMKLHYHNDLIVSPQTGVIAGGAVTALLDSCAGSVSITTLEPMGVTATIDLRIDYLRLPAPSKTIYAEVEVVRTTKYVVFTRGVAWQEKDKPLAYATGNFVNNPMLPVMKEMLFGNTKLVDQLTLRQGNY